MTNTEWLCLRLSAKIDTIAEFKAAEDTRKLRYLPGQFAETTYQKYHAQRKAQHVADMKSRSADVMERVLREMAGTAS